MENFEGDVSSVDFSSEQNFCLCFIQLISPVCLKLKVKWLNYKLKFVPVCPSLSQFVPVCLKLKVKWLNYKLKQMADQGEGLSTSSWVGEPDRVALTSEADS